MNLSIFQINDILEFYSLTKLEMDKSNLDEVKEQVLAHQAIGQRNLQLNKMAQDLQQILNSLGF